MFIFFFCLAHLKRKAIVSPKVKLILQNEHALSLPNYVEGLKEQIHSYHQINTWTSLELFGNQIAEMNRHPAVKHNDGSISSLSVLMILFLSFHLNSA